MNGKYNKIKYYQKLKKNKKILFELNFSLILISSQALKACGSSGDIVPHYEPQNPYKISIDVIDNQGKKILPSNDGEMTRYDVDFFEQTNLDELQIITSFSVVATQDKSVEWSATVVDTNEQINVEFDAQNEKAYIIFDTLLDYEDIAGRRQTTYNIRLTAKTDENTQIYSVDFFATLVDKNEKPTEIFITNLRISEDAQITDIMVDQEQEEGYFVGRIFVEDQDIQTQAFRNNILSISGTDQQYFGLTDDDRLYLKQKPDAELKNRYDIIITARDENLIDVFEQLPLTIHVTDVDEKPEFITPIPEQPVIFVENENFARELYVFQAQDPENDVIEFRVQHDDNELFIIETLYNPQEQLYEGVLRFNRHEKYNSQIAEDNIYQIEVEVYSVEGEFATWDTQQITVEIADYNYVPQRQQENLWLHGMVSGESRIIEIEYLVSIFSDPDGNDDIKSIKFLSEQLPQNISLSYISSEQIQNIAPVTDDPFILMFDDIDEIDGQKYILLTVDLSATNDGYQISYNVQDSENQEATRGAFIKFQVSDTPPLITLTDYSDENVELSPQNVFTTTIKEGQSFIGTLSAIDEQGGDVRFVSNDGELSDYIILEDDYITLEDDGSIYFNQPVDYETPLQMVDQSQSDYFQITHIYRISFTATELIGEQNPIDFVITVIVENINEKPQITTPIPAQPVIFVENEDLTRELHIFQAQDPENDVINFRLLNSYDGLFVIETRYNGQAQRYEGVLLFSRREKYNSQIAEDNIYQIEVEVYSVDGGFETWNTQQITVEIADYNYAPQRQQENLLLSYIVPGNNRIIEIEELVSIFSDPDGNDDIKSVKFLSELLPSISLSYISSGQIQNIAPVTDDPFILMFDDIDEIDGQKYILLTVDLSAVNDHYQISYNVQDSENQEASLPASINFQVYDIQGDTPPSITFTDYFGGNVELSAQSVFATTIKEGQSFIGTLLAVDEQGGEVQFIINDSELSDYITLEDDGSIYFNQRVDYEIPLTDTYRISFTATELMGAQNRTDFEITVIVEDINEAPKDIILSDPNISENIAPIINLSTGVYLYKISNMNPSGKIEISDQDRFEEFRYNELRVAAEYQDLFVVILSLTDEGNPAYDLYMLQKPDYEDIRVYRVVLEAYDRLDDRLVFSKAFIINVIDEMEDDLIVFYSDASKIIEVDEKFDISQTLYTANAIEHQGKRVFYRIDETTQMANYFAIDEVSGELRFRQTPNYEEPFSKTGDKPNPDKRGFKQWQDDNTYDVVIQAFVEAVDGGEERFESQNVKLRVNDLYDGDEQIKIVLSTSFLQYDSTKPHFANVYVYDLHSAIGLFDQQVLLKSLIVEGANADIFYIQKNPHTGVFELRIKDNMQEHLYDIKQNILPVTITASINDGDNLRVFSEQFDIISVVNNKPPELIRSEYHLGDLWIGDEEEVSIFILTTDMLRSNFDDLDGEITSFFFTSIDTPYSGALRSSDEIELFYDIDGDGEYDYNEELTQSNDNIGGGEIKIRFRIYEKKASRESYLDFIDSDGNRILNQEVIDNLLDPYNNSVKIAFKAVDDKGAISREEVKITFNIVQDKASERYTPQFVDDENNPIYLKKIYIEENLDTGISGGSVSVEGITNPQYSILSTGQNDDWQITIDENGELQINLLANYEDTKIYEMQVGAWNAGDDLQTEPKAILLLRVNITDVNEKITDLILSNNRVSESASPDLNGHYRIGNLIIVDPDYSPEFFGHNFSISGADAASFIIGDDGVLYLSEQPDIAKDSYFLTITATDDEDTTLVENFNFEIFVDLTNPPPMPPVRVRFLKDFGFIRFDDPIPLEVEELLIAFKDEDELSPIATLVFTDIPSYASLKYTSLDLSEQIEIANGDEVLLDDIEGGLDGFLTFSISPVEAENLLLRISYNVKDTEGDMSDTDSFLYFRVAEYTDLVPVFKSSSALDAPIIDSLKFERYENSGPRQLITQIYAQDSENVDAIRYSIVGGNEGEQFEIDPVTGELLFLPNPDYENHQEFELDAIYEVVVKASELDANNNENLFSTIDISLEVLDVNDPPTDVIIQSWRSDFEGNPIVSTRTPQTGLYNYYFVGTLVISDQDLENNGYINHIAIVDGDEDEFFLDEDKLYLKAQPQENIDYQVTISLQENSYEVLQKQFRIISKEQLEFNSDLVKEDGAWVIGENDFSQSNNRYHIATIIGFVDIEDLVITGSNAQYIELVEENQKINMYLKNPDSDNIIGDYRFIISHVISDQILQTFNEIILILDEELVWTDSFGGDITIDGRKTQIAFFTAEHDDEFITDITYELVDTPDAVYFEINPQSGDLIILQPIDYDYIAPLDADGDNVYELIIKATASDSITTIVLRNVNVKVIDIKEIIISSTSILEDSLAVDFNGVLHYLVGTLSVNADFTGVFLQPSGNKFNSFMVLDDNLYLSEQPDYERVGGNEYRITLVFASDEKISDEKIEQGVRREYISTDFVITVTNVDEAPFFTKNSPDWLYVDEELLGEYTLGVVRAIDQDIDIDANNNNEQVVYSIKDENQGDAQYFDVDPDTGWIKVKSTLDYENPVDTGGRYIADNIYEITVIASSTSSSGVTQTSTHTIHIEVNDIYDPDPNVDVPIFFHEAVPIMGEIITLSFDETQTKISYEMNIEPINGKNLILTIDNSNPHEDGQYFIIEPHDEDPEKKILTMNIDNVYFENPMDANGDNIYKVAVIAQYADNNGDPIPAERIRQEFQFQINDVNEAPILIEDEALRKLKTMVKTSAISMSVDGLTSAFEDEDSTVSYLHKYSKIEFTSLFDGEATYNFDNTPTSRDAFQAMHYPSLTSEALSVLIDSVEIYYFDETGVKRLMTPVTEEEIRAGKTVEFTIGSADEIWLRIHDKVTYEGKYELQYGKNYILNYKVFDALGRSSSNVAKLSFKVVTPDEYGFVPELSVNGTLLIRSLDGFDDLGRYVAPLAVDVRGKREDYKKESGYYTRFESKVGDGIKELFVASSKMRDPSHDIYHYDDNGDSIVFIDLYDNNFDDRGVISLEKQEEDSDFYSRTIERQLITAVNNPFATFYYVGEVSNSEVISMAFYPSGVNGAHLFFYGLHGDTDNLYFRGFATIKTTSIESIWTRSAAHQRFFPSSPYEAAEANVEDIDVGYFHDITRAEDVFGNNRYANLVVYDINSDGIEDLILALPNGEYIYYQSQIDQGDYFYPTGFELQTGDDDPFSDIDLYAIDPDLSDNDHYRANSPVFFDVDNDNDPDMLVGTILDDTYGDEEHGVVRYFENVGVLGNPEFVERVGIDENPFYSLFYGSGSVLTFIDIDFDGDEDLVIGDIEGGGLDYIQNIATDSHWYYGL